MTRSTSRASLSGLIATLLLIAGVTVILGATDADATSKASICHPVNGKGETGNGWNIIAPAKASSHIDEATGAGKHTTHDGRTDVYATNGHCPVSEPPAEFEAYEVDVCWTMSHTDGVEGTYEWPQTRGCEPPACGEVVEQQHDTYWIRDRADEEYLAGLTGLSSPADDARLEPHGYYSTVLTGPECETPDPDPTPTPEPTPTPDPTPTPTPTPPGPPSEPPAPSEPPVTVPPVPTVPVEPTKPPTTPPVTPDEPKTGKPPKLGPPTPPTYMACVRGTWVTVRDGKVISRSGTCNPGTPPVPLEDVAEEGF